MIQLKNAQFIEIICIFARENNQFVLAFDQFHRLALRHQI